MAVLILPDPPVLVGRTSLPFYPCPGLLDPPHLLEACICRCGFRPQKLGGCYRHPTPLDLEKTEARVSLAAFMMLITFSELQGILDTQLTVSR